jgi:hypothetical protein
MALIVADRVLETSTTTGTDPYTLAGFVVGYRAASSVCANGDTFYYYAEDVDSNGLPTGYGWETGLGTWGTGSILTRTTVHSSTNGNAAVVWLAGIRKIAMGITAAHFNSKADLASPTFTGTVTLPVVGGYTEAVTVANTSTAYTIVNTTANMFILTLTGNCVYTFPTPVAGKSFMIFQKQDATGSRTVTWPASVRWPSGITPTITSAASKGDKWVFTSDGTYWWGSNGGQNYL